MSFDSLVAKLVKEGKSEESAKKIAGAIANAKMHGAGTGPTEAQKRRHGMTQMKTNQDGGDDSTTEAADQLKELGSLTAQRSPAKESSWQHEDNIRAEWFRKHGDEGHAEALDKDADSAGYGRDWHGHESFAKQFNAKSPMARLKSPAYKHGAMKGDQSATHTDYANYKGTDKGYHGHTGSSHGDQSATHLDYIHPVHKHSRRNN